MKICIPFIMLPEIEVYLTNICCVLFSGGCGAQESNMYQIALETTKYLGFP